MARLGSRAACFLRSILAAWILCVPTTAQAQRTELHVFQSLTPTNKEFLTGDKNAKAVTLSAQLRIPRPGTDRFPTVVLLHGSGGMGNNGETWSRELVAAGVSTFAIDSFTTRGILQTVTNQDLLSRMTMVVDAYRALELIAKHPRVDPKRIYVMGFSRGGGAAHWAAIKRFQRMYGGSAEFAGFIALYPTCNRIFQDGLDVVDKPIRIFHGAADDYVPPGRCRELVERLRNTGKDATYTEFADARHVYDDPALPAVVNFPNPQTTRKCPPIEEAADGELINSETKKPFTYASDPCVERGVTIGHQAHALAETLKVVKEFVLQPAK